MNLSEKFRRDLGFTRKPAGARSGGRARRARPERSAGRGHRARGATKHPRHFYVNLKGTRGVARYGRHPLLGLPRRKRKGYYQVLHGNNWRWEHRVVVEKVTGIRLKRHQPIHHINGNKLDNSPGNLLVCESWDYHKLLHQRCKKIFGTWHLEEAA